MESVKAILVRAFNNDHIAVKPLPPHVYTWIFSVMACCTACFVLSHILSQLLSKSYRALSTVEKMEWNSRVVSNIHAIIAAQGSFRAVFFDPAIVNDNALGASEFSRFYQCITFGYLAYDFLLVATFYPKLGGVDTIMHHFFGGLGYLLTTFYHAGHFWTIIFGFTESTTPFTNQRWFLDKSGLRESTAYTINGLLLWLTWIPVRLALVPFLAYKLYMNFARIWALWTPLAVGFLLVLSFIINVLNVYWFYKITLGVIKVLKGEAPSVAKGKKKSPPTTSNLDVAANVSIDTKTTTKPALLSVGRPTLKQKDS